MTLATYKEFLEKFDVVSDEFLTDIVQNGKRLFHDPEHQKEWCDQNKLAPHSVGIFLGETKKDFQPTPYCYERISRHVNEEVIVDAKGAWLFLCGRDIFGKAVKSGTPKLGTHVFLYDENHNLLGYGVWTADSLAKNKPVIKNVHDKGVYLRRR